MRWPRKRETRAAGNGGGDLFSAVVAQLDAQAATKAADAGRTAAIEAAAGQLSRALAAAKCDHPAVTPAFLAQYGRDLIRGGASLHRMDFARGRLRLNPVAQWHWVGHGSDPAGWSVAATDYGPSGSRTEWLPFERVVWGCWGVSAATPWVGRGPASWAGLTAKQAAEAERSIGDEAAGPVAQLIPIPDGDGAEGDEDEDSDDPTTKLRADIAKARGKALLVETTASGWAEGQSEAPHRDWVPKRLGPEYPAAVVESARDGFARLLAAAGTNVSLFSEADGTAQREALRRWHMGTVVPVAALLEAELTAKLETPISFEFDPYPLDVVARAAALSNLVSAGVPVGDAAAAVNVLDADG